VSEHLTSASTTRVHDALGRLGLRMSVRGTHTQAICPAHDDRAESLSIDYRDGRTLIYCHAGCRTEAVAAALGLALTDLYDEPPAKPAGPKARAPRAPRPQSATTPASTRAHECLDRWARHELRETTRYPYVDAAGTVLGFRVRKQCQRDGCAGKTFSWLKIDEHGRLSPGMPDPRPLYGLVAASEAIAAGATIYVTEGEKDADAATQAGAVGVTMGAADNGTGSSWKPWHTKALIGAREVIICADRDQPGRTSARYVAGELRAAGVPLVRIVQATQGKDVADHLSAGLGLAELVDITAEIEAGPTTKPTTQIDLRDDGGPTGDTPGKYLAVPDAPDAMTYTDAAGTCYRQWGQIGIRAPRLVEVIRTKAAGAAGDDQDTDQPKETEKPLVRGTLAVSDVYVLRGITADCTPTAETAGTMYQVDFTPPQGQTRTARITDMELRGTKDMEWPGRLGLDSHVTTQTIKKLPDAVRAQALDRKEREAYDATGLLIRAGQLPMFLRSGRPALTGTPGQSEASLITQLPAALEATPGLHHLTLADPSTSDQAGDDWWDTWAVREITADGDPGVPLLLLALLFAAPWSNLPGMIIPSAYLDAPTGTGKSTLTGLITGWQSDTFTPNAADSSAVVMSAESMSSVGSRSVLAMFRGHVIAVDDFYPRGQSPQETARQTAILNVIGRGTRSGASDVKGQRDGGLRAGRAMRSAVLATGEAFTDPKSSQSARFVHARMTPETLGLGAHRSSGTRNEALDQAQAKVRATARLHTALIVAGLADLDTIHEAARWAADQVTKWAVPGNSHLPAGYAAVLIGGRLFAQHGGRLGCQDPEATSDAFAEALRAMAQNQGSASTVRNALAERHGPTVETIITSLRALILAATWRIDGHKIGTPPEVPGFAPAAFGWTKTTSTGAYPSDDQWKPQDRLGNPIGTVHTYTPGGAGRPPAWPARAGATDSVTMWITPDDWNRIYAQIAEGDAGMYLPSADDARGILAGAGYLGGSVAVMRGGHRVLILDLGRVLAGEAGADGDPEAPASDTNHDPGGPSGELTAQAAGINSGINSATDSASSQVNGVNSINSINSATPPIGSDARGVCPQCGSAMEAWRQTEALVCLDCFDRDRARPTPRAMAHRPQARPATVDQHGPNTPGPVLVGLDGLPTHCPGCAQPVGASERVRAAYAGWHLGCAPDEIRTAGNATLDATRAPQGAQRGITAPTGAADATKGPQAPQRGATDASVADLAKAAQWLRSTERGGGFPDATDPEVTEAVRLWGQAVHTKDDTPVRFVHPTPTATYLLRGWTKAGDQARKNQGGGAMGALDDAHTKGLAELDRWTITSHGVGGPWKAGDPIGAYDVNAMYLNAADARLGIGSPEAEGDVPEDWRKRAGWVRLAEAPGRLPYGFDDRLKVGKWVPVPLAAYLAEQAGTPLTFDRAWLWSARDSVQPLKSLRAALVEARTYLTQFEGRPARMAERMLKATYTRAFGGLLNSPTHNRGKTLRPDWAELIRAEAVQRMLRGLDKAGLDGHVMGFQVDAAVIDLAGVPLTPGGHPEGLVISAQVGKFKPVGTSITLDAKHVSAAMAGRVHARLLTQMKGA